VSARLILEINAGELLPVVTRTTKQAGCSSAVPAVKREAEEEWPLIDQRIHYDAQRCQVWRGSRFSPVRKRAEKTPAKKAIAATS